MHDPELHRRRPQYSVGCLLLSVTFAALLLAWLGYLFHLRNAWLAEVEMQQKQDKLTVRQVVVDVEAACKKLGHAPKDQEELESVLGKPLPNVHDDGYPTPIHYQRTGETSFILQYELFATDDWIYDSSRPEAGWVQHWY